MRYIIMSVLLVFLLLAPVNITSGQSPADHPEHASVVAIVTTQGSNFRQVYIGTGFLVTPDGLALTVAHVPYIVTKDPSAHLIVLWVNPEGERVYFMGELVCSNPLPYDPTEKNVIVPKYTKDLAVIQIRPVPHNAGWFKTWGYPLPGGQRYDYSARDQLPTFTPLRLATRLPGSGEAVNLPGYSVISALPRPFTATGSIDKTFTGADGTPVFSMKFTNPARGGDSGGPVMDAQNGEVLGIDAWGNKRPGSDATVGAGISVAALHHPCGDVNL